MTKTSLPDLMTADEVALALRKTRKAVYTMAERGQLPGAFKMGHRLFVRQDLLASWLLAQGTAAVDSAAPSSEVQPVPAPVPPGPIHIEGKP